MLCPDRLFTFVRNICRAECYDTVKATICGLTLQQTLVIRNKVGPRCPTNATAVALLIAKECDMKTHIGRLRSEQTMLIRNKVALNVMPRYS